MDGWTIGLIALVVAGLAAILYGALSDRRKNRRAAAEMLAPPAREIPHFTPQSAAPTYLSDLQARRAPAAAATPTTPSAREELDRQLAAADTVTIDAGWASADFVTDKAGNRAILDDPRILVCAEPVATMRELLGVLEKLVLRRRSLVIVAPALATEVRRTLEVNQIQQTMRLLAVTGLDATGLDKVVAATGATPVDSSDLRSGFVPLERLGRAARWVSTKSTSYVIARVEDDVPVADDGTGVTPAPTEPDA